MLTYVREIPCKHRWAAKIEGYMKQMEQVHFLEESVEQLSIMVKDIHVVRESVRNKLTLGFQLKVKEQTLALHPSP